MARLFPAEQVSCTTNLKVFESNLNTRAQLVIHRECVETVVCCFAERCGLVIEEIGIGALASTTHATTQLVELAQAILICPVHDQRVGVGNIQTGLDDGGGDQHIELAFPEVDNDLLKLVLSELTVSNTHACFGYEFCDLGGNAVNAGDTVVNEEDLTFTQNLTTNSGGGLLLRIGPHEGEDRVAILRRGGQGRHFTNARDGHFKCARNGRRTHGQNVDIGLELLQCILVLHTKALLFIDDDEP